MSTDQSPAGAREERRRDSGSAEDQAESGAWTWTPEQPGGVLWDTDLDQPAPGRAPREPRSTAGIARGAAVLAALGIGALAGALIAPAAPPRPPPSVTLAVQDAYVTSGPVLGVRLTIGNAGDEPARLTGLVVEGAGNSRIVERLDVRVGGHGSAVADVTLRPRCPDGRGRKPRAHVIAPSEPSGVIPVTLPRALTAVGGFCSAFDTRLPTGWATALPALSTVQDGVDLVVTVRDLSKDRLTGILVDDQLLPTVFVSDQLITSSARLRPGQNSELRLRGPAPCIVTNAGEPGPTTMRLLAQGDNELVQRLVVAGPELTRWVRQNCETKTVERAAK